MPDRAGSFAERPSYPALSLVETIPLPAESLARVPATPGQRRRFIARCRIAIPWMGRGAPLRRRLLCEGHVTPGSGLVGRACWRAQRPRVHGGRHGPHQARGEFVVTTMYRPDGQRRKTPHRQKASRFLHSRMDHALRMPELVVACARCRVAVSAGRVILSCFGIIMPQHTFPRAVLPCRRGYSRAGCAVHRGTVASHSQGSLNRADGPGVSLRCAGDRGRMPYSRKASKKREIQG